MEMEQETLGSVSEQWTGLPTPGHRDMRDMATNCPQTHALSIISSNFGEAGVLFSMFMVVNNLEI